MPQLMAERLSHPVEAQGLLNQAGEQRRCSSLGEVMGALRESELVPEEFLSFNHDGQEAL